MDGVEFEVDVELFIEEIKQHRSIWDMNSEEYYDKGKKQLAWEEVCKNTFLDFHTKSENERNSIIKKLSLKWKNIKDNNMRSLRKRKSGLPVRKYVYAKHLSFLHDSMALDASAEDPSIDSASSQADQEEESSPDPVASIHPTTPSARKAAAAIRQQKSEPSSIQFMSTPLIDETTDSNRLFFDSLIPMMKNFTEDQTLQFRCEVIELIRRIKRQNTVKPETQTTF